MMQQEPDQTNFKSETGLELWEFKWNEMYQSYSTPDVFKLTEPKQTLRL